MLQNFEKEKKKFTRRLQAHQNEDTGVPEDLITEAMLRSSIDRLQSLLPSHRTRKPKNPRFESRPNTGDIPYFSSNTTSVPWLDLSTYKELDLTHELNCFAKYVAVCNSFTIICSV